MTKTSQTHEDYIQELASAARGAQQAIGMSSHELRITALKEAAKEIKDHVAFWKDVKVQE